MLSHRGLLSEKYEKLQEQLVSLGDGWGPVSLECCLKLPHNNTPIVQFRSYEGSIETVEFSDLPTSRCGLLLLKYPEL